MREDKGQEEEGVDEQASDTSGSGTRRSQQPVPPGRSAPSDSWWSGDFAHVDEEPDH